MKVIFQTDKENSIYVTWFTITDMTDDNKDEKEHHEYEININSSSVVARIEIDEEAFLNLRDAINKEYKDHEEHFKNTRKYLNDWRKKHENKKHGDKTTS